VFVTACGGGSGGAAAAKGDGGAPDVGKIALPDAGHDAGHAVVDARGGDVAVAHPSDAASEGGPSTTYPAPHPAMAQVANAGGPVMKSPKFVVITFTGDPDAPSIDDFVAKVAASKTYWSGTTAEYGVGPIASVIPITVDETPASSLQDSDVQAWITGKLTATDAGVADGSVPWPAPDGDTVYMIYYPSSVTVAMGGGTTCSEFYGYHDDFALASGAYVTYSVVATCPPFPMTSQIDSITSIASHEMIEAVTDPRVSDMPAYVLPDQDHMAWGVPAGGELGDMCAGYGNVFYTPTDVPYLVQRTWSNKAAAAGHDPCQPDGATPYFNAGAVFSKTFTVNDPMAGTYTSQGIEIPVGGTGTVELELYSDAPTTAPFTVTAGDLSSIFGGPAELEVTFNGQPTATGVNGDHLTMTIKVVAAGSGNAEVLWIQSSQGQTMPVWIGLVSNGTLE
jgi:hypothetical protein